MKTKEEIIEEVWKKWGVFPHQRISITFAKECLNIQKEEFIELIDQARKEQWTLLELRNKVIGDK